MRPRGNAMWTGTVRGTGVVAVLGLILILVVPEAGPLVGFEIFTLWISGPLSPLTPVGYESVLMLFGKVYPPLLVATVGMAGALYIEFLNYHLYGKLMDLSAMQALRESELVQRLKSYFERWPFTTIWFCAWSPFPFWTVRFLAPIAGYPMRRYLLALLLGRFPKIWFFAAVGLWWRPSDRLLLGILAASLLGGGGYWAYNRFREGGEADPAPGSSAPGSGELSPVPVSPSSSEQSERKAS